MSRKIVRILWGDQERVLNEIPKKPVWENEVVLVWGTKNYKTLRSYGYDCILVSPNVLDSQQFSDTRHFGHKLLAFEIADDLYDEYLHMDWDVKIVKPIDNNFWNLVSSKQIQCATYAYPRNYYEAACKQIDTQKWWPAEYNDATKKWVQLQDQMLKQYHWNINDTFTIPNLCFYYSYKGKLGRKLMNIFRENEHLATCLDEFSLFIHINKTNTSFDDYLTRYEPLVIRGREDTLKHFEIPDDTSIAKLNAYIESKIKKDIYLTHSHDKY